MTLGVHSSVIKTSDKRAQQKRCVKITRWSKKQPSNFPLFLIAVAWKSVVWKELKH